MTRIQVRRCRDTGQWLMLAALGPVARFRTWPEAMAAADQSAQLLRFLSGGKPWFPVVPS